MDEHTPKNFYGRALGRVFLLRSSDALDGSGPAPQQVVQMGRRLGTRFLLLDTTAVPYADSAGLRWLMRLRDELETAGLRLRVAARPQGKVGRALTLLQLGLEVYESPARAWRAPWSGRKAA